MLKAFLLASALSTAPATSTPAPAPPPIKAWKVAALSLFVPGGGHFLLGQNGRGFTYLGGELALLGAGVGAVVTSPVSGDRELDSRRILARGFLPLVALQNVHFVGMYDAYREARLRNHFNRGYRFPVPNSSVSDLARAPFRWRVIKRPAVWGPLVAAGLAGVAITALERPTTGPNLFEIGRAPVFGRDIPAAGAFAAGESMYAAAFWTVAMGEEAAFRGVMQTGLVEKLGPTGGIATASALFGLAHYFNGGGDPLAGLLAVAYTGTFGAYLGTLYYLDHYSLEAPVALHFWYDLLVSAASFILFPEEQVFSVRVGFPF